MEKNLAWRIGDGALVNCWSANWIPSVGNLCEVAQRPLSQSELNLRVANLRTVSGGWNLNAIAGIIPSQVVQVIMSMAAPNAARGVDRVAWKLTADGVFSNASAYEALLDTSQRMPNGPFKKI